MCTSIAYNNGSFFFGRNLDLEYSFNEQVVVTPRNYHYPMRHMPDLETHYAMMGTATMAGDYPLYAEGMNEKGLAMAGLYFPGNAVFTPLSELGGEDVIPIAPFEFIPWVLGKFTEVAQIRALLDRLVLVDEAFGDGLPIAPLHWMISDAHQSVVVESTETGLRYYDNPIGVLTNNPGFEFHQTNLNNYLSLCSHQPENSFSQRLALTPAGQGFGAIGLPGDWSPASRFIRAAFGLHNSVCEGAELAQVHQFFHLLGSVSMVRGLVMTPEGNCDITTYSCCMSAATRTFYYQTYDNLQLTAVRMDQVDLEGDTPSIWPMRKEPNIFYEN